MYILIVNRFMMHFSDHDHFRRLVGCLNFGSYSVVMIIFTAPFISSDVKLLIDATHTVSTCDCTRCVLSVVRLQLLRVNVIIFVHLHLHS